MLEAKRNLVTEDIIVRFSDEEFADKTVVYAMEMVATRLADEFMQKYGEQSLKEMGLEEMKKDIATKIEERLLEISEQSKDKI